MKKTLSDDAEAVDLRMTKLFEFDLPGTYLKVIGGIGPEPDMSLILYLQRNGRFLFLGYYPGYEKSVAAGRWSRDGTTVYLVGRGHLNTDTNPGPAGGRFERELLLEEDDFTPQLRAGEELKGWSLLSWRGPFVYAGGNIIDPDGRWLPNSWARSRIGLRAPMAKAHEIAQENKDIIERRMTREQIAEAQRLSTEWLEAHPGGN